VQALLLFRLTISSQEEAIATAPKLGFDTGLKVKHPFIEGKTLPVYIANFVLMGYGTGAVFGCPAHDQRDLDFIHAMNKNSPDAKLEIIPVVKPLSSAHPDESRGPEPQTADSETLGPDVRRDERGEIVDAFTGEGTLFNSDFLDGLGKGLPDTRH